MTSKTAKNQIDGVLLLNKPLGLSSNAALQKAKRIFNAQKAGHTGTLDPLATGLLPICFGEATKFSSFLLEGNKEYIATIKLGQTTTTYDAEGEVTGSNPVECDAKQIYDCVSSFVGNITQVPPIYSALKVNGKALYEYARSGEEVTIKSRQISIQEIELVEQAKTDIVRIRVVCSKGTYIRTLANDIGQKLGCGAHLIGLIRTKSNEFTLDESITLEKIAGLMPVEQQKLLLPADVFLLQLPRLDLNDAEFTCVKHGHGFSGADSHTVGQVRLYHLGKFLGLAIIEQFQVKPKRLINTADLI